MTFFVNIILPFLIGYTLSLVTVHVRHKRAVGWRPIATAPRDGTPIWAVLNFQDGPCEQAVVKWVGDDDFPWEILYNSANSGCAGDIPTHWMPRPELP